MFDIFDMSSYHANICVFGVSLPLLLWCSWWVWTFKIQPWMRPFDAPLYPYYIPGKLTKSLQSIMH